MPRGRSYVPSPFLNFPVLYLYIMFFSASTFLAHKFLMHHNAEAGRVQAHDFDILTVNDGDSVLHSPETFRMNLEKMDNEFKIYMYPEEDFDTFLFKNYADLMEIYAKEQYFFKNLRDSRFLTDDPDEAHLFFIPISCQRMKLQNEAQANVVARIENYVQSLIQSYPYWNRTLGADHFYMTCHDIDLLTTENTPFLEKNAIRVIYSPSYVEGYIPHKDILLPEVSLQVAPPPDEHEMDDINALENDIDENRYGDLTGDVSVKLCINIGRFQAQILQCIHNGSVPVIFSGYNDLPFIDILNWRKFSIIQRSSQFHELKDMHISNAEFTRLHNNLLKVQKSFTWNIRAVKLDAFHMVMYELWLRHHAVRYVE